MQQENVAENSGKKDLIGRLFREEIMRESVIYQEILDEGKREEALSLTRCLLTRKIGTLEPELEAQIRELTTQELEDLGEALLDFSEPANLAAWLQERQDSRHD